LTIVQLAQHDDSPGASHGCHTSAHKVDCLDVHGRWPFGACLPALALAVTLTASRQPYIHLDLSCSYAVPVTLE